jgi:hypothetical protein
MKTNKVREALNCLEAGKGYKELTLDEFREVYHKIINRKILNDHTVFAVFIENRILIAFPEKPDVRFVIKREKGFFSEDNLKNFVHNLEPMGTYKGKLKFSAFLKKEFKLNWLKIISLFFPTFLLFSISGAVSMLQRVNEMILASATIFISIFLLFVISQRELKNESKLMRDGIPYEFMQNDKYVATMAIIAIFLSIITMAFSYFDLSYLINFKNFTIDLMFFSLSFLTSFTLVILAICYISIVQYYFERVKFLRLLPASQEILEDRLKKYVDLQKNEEGGGVVKGNQR